MSLNHPQLPINSVLPKIIATLKTHNRMVLQAPPGAGKTTATPLALLGQPWLKNRQILMLEPRRIAARNSARRMAQLLNEPIGQTVGYQIKQDHCYSDKTKILVVTEGILTRKLQADPELSNTAIVIFDEFHERSIHADLSLALCLQSQQILREDLKILVMSATLDTVAIAELLDNAPIIQSEGRCFPVDIHFSDKAIKHSDAQQLLSALFNTCQHVIENHTGSCLIFLPGVKEIVALQNQLNRYLQTHPSQSDITNIVITCLHGTLSKKEQDQAIRKPASNIRKFVLSTNIAETSLTIEGIDCVIDAGLERVQHYKAASGMNQLQTQLISNDSAEQRSGRAGRLSAGTSYRLWTRQQDKSLVQHASAEICHSDLASLTLELANWGIQDPAELQWLDIPPPNHINKARSLLQQLNALDSDFKITEHGRQLLSIGTHPRLAHMMLSSLKHKLAYSACLITAILSEKDVLRGSDNASYLIEDRLKMLLRTNQTTNKITSQKTNYKPHFKTAEDFFKRLKKIKPDITKTNSDNDGDKVGLLLAYAYPDRIAKRRDNTHQRYLLSNGKGASIPEFMTSDAEAFLVIANLNGGQNKARAEAQIYLAAEISQTQIEDHHSSFIQTETQIQWNEQSERVESKKFSSLGQIRLNEEVIIADNQEEIQNLLIDALQRKGLDCLNWSKKALELKQRLQFIQLQARTSENVKTTIRNLGDMAELADFSDTALNKNLVIWLQPHLRLENSFKQLQKVDLYPCLLSLLSWSQQQHVNQLTPEFISVPSGSNIRIDYSDSQQPVLAVRLQEVFGMLDTPLILNGHFQLMMHLLSPARKPMQITQDLNSFWKTTYHEVKKELRGKYKRHYWPDDPFTAEATSKTKKNMHRK